MALSEGCHGSLCFKDLIKVHPLEVNIRAFPGDVHDDHWYGEIHDICDRTVVIRSRDWNATDWQAPGFETKVPECVLWGVSGRCVSPTYYTLAAQENGETENVLAPIMRSP